jgi:hypothetical protein
MDMCGEIRLSHIDDTDSEQSFESKKRKFSHENNICGKAIIPITADINLPSSISSINSSRKHEFLPLEWWERSEDCKESKYEHSNIIDDYDISRERLIYLTVLDETDIALETNMFPYETPEGIEHYTLWSKYDLTHDEIVKFVDNYLLINFPHVKRWQYDDNLGERSIDIFHVHIFIETIPYIFTPSVGNEYFPPHMKIDNDDDVDDDDDDTVTTTSSPLSHIDDNEVVKEAHSNEFKRDKY